MKKIILLCILLFPQLSNACTGFGIITDSGTIIGRNRDYYYNPQKFELMVPIQQFNNWYENNYHHNNSFYALTSKNNVSMAINENGLTIIEEDSPLPKNAKENRRFQQPENGTAEGMIKYGIMQNFNTVAEIIPFIAKIFSMADPHFYQIADAKNILTVEVAYGDTNTDLKRDFTYKILSKKNAYFTHANTYLTPKYVALNTIRIDPKLFNGANSRLQKITNLVSHAKVINIDIATKWLMDTRSEISSESDPNACLDTSLFRSNMQGFKSVDLNLGTDKIYGNAIGTVSSMIVSNNGDIKKSYIYLIMVDSITADGNNKQIIKYKELRTTLAQLFGGAKPVFVDHEFVRNPPVNGICS